MVRDADLNPNIKDQKAYLNFYALQWQKKALDWPGLFLQIREP